MHADVSALNKIGIWHEASRIVKEEGFRAFWKGNLVTVVHRLPYSAVNFYSYEQYKKVRSNSYMQVYFIVEGVHYLSTLDHFSFCRCCNLSPPFIARDRMQNKTHVLTLWLVDFPV